MRHRRRRASWIGALAATGALLAGAVGTAAAAPAPEAVRTVGYHGYEVQVPASWKVVDLSRRPDACVRFDTPAVYLGHPGDTPDCPAGLIGRTAGLVIEPIDKRSAAHITPDVATAAQGSAAAPAHAPSRNDSVQVAVEDAGVLVTAVHTATTEGLVRDILQAAELTSGGTPTALPEPAAAPTLRAATPQPGTYTGKGFDACTAPSQSAMNAWLGSSPYRSIGIYISGGVRACSQANLTAGWVSTQISSGWHLIPIEVGLQAPCSSFSSKISTTPSTARSQGASAAANSASVAASLGIAAGSTIYNDIEGYPSTASCKASVLSFLSGWTDELHARGYLGGVYSSAGSGIRDVADAFGDTSYTPVDHIWFALWNSQADTDASGYVSASLWAAHQRIHQYHGGQNETYGGVTINVDGNYLDVAAGTPPPVDACVAASIDFSSYATLRSGSTGAQVTAAQCLLHAAGHSTGSDDPSGVFDAATVAAATAFQQAHGLTADGIVGAHTWTALLSRGTVPTLQNGSTGSAVSRLQRALTAALSRTVAIDGIFGSGTAQAVTDYQSSRGLGADGIVGPQTWTALQAGK
jgi:peptidoglycan hydrolase-like protein with peptidoglycan-binding domain